MSSLKYLYKSGILKDFRSIDLADIDRTIKAFQSTGMVVLLKKPQERSSGGGKRKPQERSSSKGKRKRIMSAKKQTKFEKMHKWVLELLDRLESSYPPKKPQN